MEAKLGKNIPFFFDYILNLFYGGSISNKKIEEYVSAVDSSIFFISSNNQLPLLLNSIVLNSKLKIL